MFLILLAGATVVKWNLYRDTGKQVEESILRLHETNKAEKAEEKAKAAIAEDAGETATTEPEAPKN